MVEGQRRNDRVGSERLERKKGALQFCRLFWWKCGETNTPLIEDIAYGYIVEQRAASVQVAEREGKSVYMGESWNPVLGKRF